MDLLIFQAPILMVQASMDGILLGILFALIAYGMALQWGVMNIINIAQGELVIMGGYVAYFMYVIGITSEVSINDATFGSLSIFKKAHNLSLLELSQLCLSTCF